MLEGMSFKSNRLRKIARLVTGTLRRSRNRTDANPRHFPEDDFPEGPVDVRFDEGRAFELSVTSSVMAAKRAGDHKGIVGPGRR